MRQAYAISDQELLICEERDDQQFISYVNLQEYQHPEPQQQQLLSQSRLEKITDLVFGLVFLMVMWTFVTWVFIKAVEALTR